jgi:hypothetical protein
MVHGIRNCRRPAGNSDLANTFAPDRIDVLVYLVDPGSIDDRNICILNFTGEYFMKKGL